MTQQDPFITIKTSNETVKIHSSQLIVENMLQLFNKNQKFHLMSDDGIVIFPNKKQIDNDTQTHCFCTVT